MPSKKAMEIAEKHYDLLGGVDAVKELRLHVAECIDEGVKELVNAMDIAHAHLDGSSVVKRRTLEGPQFYDEKEICEMASDALEGWAD